MSKNDWRRLNNFSKWVIPGLYSFILIFCNTVDNKQMPIIYFVDDWIRTAAEQPHYQHATTTAHIF